MKWLLVVCAAGCESLSAVDANERDADAGFIEPLPRTRREVVDGGPLSVSGCRSISGRQLLVRASTIVDPSSCVVLLYELTAFADGGFEPQLVRAGVTGPCFGPPFGYLDRDAGFAPSIYWEAEQLDFEVSIFGVNGRPFAFDIDGGGIWSDTRPVDGGGSLRAFRVRDFAGASAQCTF